MLATTLSTPSIAPGRAMSDTATTVAACPSMGIGAKRAGSVPIWASSTDAELGAALESGDHAALEESYRRHGAAVYGIARRVLRRDDLAEDVAQDVFVRLWNQPQRYDSTRGSLRTFLQREAHSRSIERVRAEEARDRRERNVERTTADDMGLESEVLATIESESIRRALDELEPPVRSAIILAYYGGLSYREVAARLDEPEGTVKSRIRTGLARLATSLSDGTEVER